MMEYDLQHTDKKFKKDEEMETDRLSNLPNSVIYLILSLTDTKSAVRSCVLSKKWKHHWIHIDSLHFDSKSFSNWNAFKAFVLTVLEKLQSCNLSSLRLFCGSIHDQYLVKRSLDYAKLHNVLELEIDACGFPQSYFSCETLKTLKLGPGIIKGIPIPFDFTPLKTLQLSGLNLSYRCLNYEIFSGCVNLENLLITRCNLKIVWIFRISVPHLSTLTISDLEFDYMLGITAPKLKYFYYSGTCPPMWVMHNCAALEKVEITTYGVRDKSLMMYLARQISHAQTIALSFDTCEGEKFIVSRDTPKGEFRLVPCISDKQVCSVGDGDDVAADDDVSLSTESLHALQSSSALSTGEPNLACTSSSNNSISDE